MSFDLKIINGDFVIKDGDVDTLTGQEKLIQDILKVCLTSIGSNIYQPWYGSSLSRNIIGSVLDGDITIAMAQGQLQNSIDMLKKLQQLQLISSNQTIIPSEHIAAIKEIKVARDISDPRSYNISVNVLNKSFTTTQTNFAISGA